MMISGKLYTECDTIQGVMMFGEDAPKWVYAFLDYESKILTIMGSSSTTTRVLEDQVFKWAQAVLPYGENACREAIEHIEKLYKQDGGPAPDGVRALEL